MLEWYGEGMAKIGVLIGDGGCEMSRMLKGCQRKMIIVQGRDKGIFETAYFVLRRESEKRSLRDSDLLEEANRIINEQQLHDPKAGKCRRHRWTGVLLWLGGVLMGIGGTVIVTVLVR